jgi:hypothetical protein
VDKAASVSTTSEPDRRGVVWLLPKIGRHLKTGDQATTIDRLFDSKHVKDLQLIVAAALAVLAFVFVLGLLFFVGNELVSPPSSTVQLVVDDKPVSAVPNSVPMAVKKKPESEGSSSGWALFVRAAVTGISKFIVFFVPVLGVVGAVVAWAYQSGSARLGVIDLFACEISSLCRVATVVDTARRYADKFNQPPTAAADTTGPHQPPHQFASKENYFPVFESNTRDLQTLEARVVINITEFYTYMKAFRDYLRTLAEITPQMDKLDSSSLSRSWHESVVNVVFMLFLGLESGRHAIADLVEFQPEKAERTIVILISELEAYRFLRSQFTEKQDVRYQRLNLRESVYQQLVPDLIKSVEAERAGEKARKAEEKLIELKRWDRPPQASQWEPAVRLLPLLKTRYQACEDLWDPPRQPHASTETMRTVVQRPRRRA